MRLTLLQTDIIPANYTANLAAASALISSAPAADLYILPEMFATGFIVSPTPADAESGRAVTRWMTDTATSLKAHIAASVLVAEQGRFYNRFTLAAPDGSTTTADKRHLFSMGGEAKAYAPGVRRVVVNVAGVRLLLTVCYDLRFPVWSRTVAADYDAMVCVANWPASRMLQWDTLLRARAIENQAYLVGVNRVGTAGKIAYSGHSQAFDPWGADMARCPDGEVSALAVDISAERVAEVRRKFPALADADEFSLA